MLTFRDKVILVIMAFVICIYGGYQAFWIPSATKISELEKHKASIENLAGDLEPLKKEIKRLKKSEKRVKDSVNNIKKLSGGLTATNEEFLVFLGQSAKENNVVVSGFNDLGTEVNGGIYRSFLDFELKGNSVDINKVLEDICNMGIKCSFGSVSYRQNEGYDYLKRFFDDLTELPWYKEQEKDEAEEEKNEQEENTQTSETEELVPETNAGQIPQQQIPVEPDTTEEPEEPQEPLNEDEKSESIEERLNDLLSQTAYVNNKLYRAVFLTENKNDFPETGYKAGQQMRLNVTVCLIMYNEPCFESSFLNKTESENDAVF